MRKLWPVILALGLVTLGTAFFLFGLQHARLYHSDDVFGGYHAWAAVAWLPAGLLLALAGDRLCRNPALWQRYPFLCMGRFWRWLLGGIIAVFLVLGWLYPGQDVARYPCRAFSGLWLAVMISPLVWPHRWWCRLEAVRSSRVLRSFDLIVGNIVVFLVVAEIGLRGVAFYRGEDALLLNRAVGYRLKPGEYPHGLRVNSLGFADTEFRLDKVPGRRRLAALGDSFSAGVAVAYEDNYLTLLEQFLPDTEVYNFGVCGTGPREYRQLLQRMVWRYQPDFVLVPIFIGNDITEWIASPRLSKFHPDSLYVGVVGRRLFRLARERLRLAAEGGEYRMTGQPSFSARTYLELTAGRLTVCRQPVRPDIERRWRQVFAELSQLIADCRSRDVPVAVVLLPDEFQVDAELRKRALAHRGWSEADIDLRLPQRRLSEFCQHHGVPCCDLWPVFAAVGSKAYLPNDSHWNVFGHRLAAETVAPWLREQWLDNQETRSLTATTPPR